MSRRALALGLAAGGVLLALVLVGQQQGVIGPAQPRVELAGATAAVLDTVTVRGRVVTASVDGVVSQVDGDGAVWVVSGGDAFPVRFDDAPGLAVEDRVLVTGRVRARGGRRWLDAQSWARVVTSVAPPPGPGL